MEKSLCRTCRHVASCSLTSNKNFIWSCSEYELAKDKEDKDINIQPQTITKEFQTASKKQAVELV